MKEDELLGNLMMFACDDLTFEERRSIPLEEWKDFVKTHYRPVPKCELEKGRTYRGVCRNAGKAVWDGEKFTYERYKFGITYPETINHFEDDDPEEKWDVFVPVEYVD